MYDIPELPVEVSFEKLKAQATTISTEAMTGDQVISAFTGGLKKFVEQFKGVAKSLFQGTANIRGGYNVMNLRLLLEKHPYSETSALSVTIPRGLVGSYKEAIKQLDECLTSIENFHEATQLPFERWLGRILGTPNEMRSMRDIKTASGAAIFSVEGLTNKLTAMYTDKPGTTAPLATVARSNNELLEDYIKIEALIDRANNLKLQAMVRSMNTTNSLLEKIATRAAEDGNEYRISGPTLSFIADASLSVIEQARLSGLVLFHLKGLAEAMWETERKLRRSY